MFSLVLTVHIILCVMLIGLVLKQQGKGADMGATFGGGSNTLFGAGGANDLVVKLTTILAICFFVTSVLLIHLYRTSGITVRTNSALTESSVVTQPASKEPATAPISDAQPDTQPNAENGVGVEHVGEPATASNVPPVAPVEVSPQAAVAPAVIPPADVSPSRVSSGVVPPAAAPQVDAGKASGDVPSGNGVVHPKSSDSAKVSPQKNPGKKK